MKKRLLKLDRNRVRRNYQGGRNLDRVQGMQSSGDMPEEWIASLVEARNPGLEEIPGEGLSSAGGIRLLDIIKSDPVFYLGERHYREKGIDLGFLAKVLDSSMRLHVQAHPTASFAREHLGSRYGKLECYYILGKKDGYIRLGFQHNPGREEWKRIIEEQDIEAMDRCFEKIPVHPGEVWYIPGAVPHAIGEDITMIEIMEPSDLVVRCEFERLGIVVPPEARFMGRGLDFCLDIFRYEEESVEQVTKCYRLERKLISETSEGSVECLVGPEIASTFRVLLCTLDGEMEIKGGESRVLIDVEGNISASYSEYDRVDLSLWESAFSAYSEEPMTVRGKGSLLIVESVIL